MNNIVLSRIIRSSRTGSVLIPLLYPALCISRPASLNSAINHGIRRSKGIGFRGKERSQTRDSGPSYGGKDGFQRKPEQSFRRSTRSQVNNVESEDSPSTFSSRRRHSSDTPRDSASTYGKKGLGRDRISRGRLRDGELDARSLGRSTPRSSKASDRGGS